MSYLFAVNGWTIWKAISDLIYIYIYPIASGSFRRPLSFFTHLLYCRIQHVFAHAAGRLGPLAACGTNASRLARCASTDSGRLSSWSAITRLEFQHMLLSTRLSGHGRCSLFFSLWGIWAFFNWRDTCVWIPGLVFLYVAVHPGSVNLVYPLWSIWAITNLEPLVTDAPRRTITASCGRPLTSFASAQCARNSRGRQRADWGWVLQVRTMIT